MRDHAEIESTSKFSVWMQQRRKMLDLTGEELARLVGCSAGTIRMLESGRRRPSKQIAALLADHLQIAPEERANFIGFARQSPATSSTAVDAAVTSQSAASPATPTGTRFKLSDRRHATNLPPVSTPLIGREWELATLRNRIQRDDARLLTLVGPPGIGKTHLSIELARSLLHDFEDGAFFISLAAITEPERVATTLLHGLGLSGSGSVPPLMALKMALREKQLLLVLDNFEQVVGAAAQVSELLLECAWVKVIVTSREPLRLRAERQFAVPSLALPPPVTQGELTVAQSGQALHTYAAINLFVERAQAINAAFELDDSNASAIAAICANLEGNPLSIALAASWVNTLSCGEIAHEIKRNLDFLTATTQDMPERHRSLRAAFDHSWQLLTEPERQVLTGLSVFRGGFDREAAERVADATLQILSALVTKSLIRRNPISHDDRYDLHEFVRQYAAERMGLDRYEIYRDRHQQHFAKQADALEPSWLGRDQTVLLPHWLAELDNLRTAIAWGLGEASNMARRVAAATLISMLHSLWRITGELGSARAQLGELLSRSDTLPQALRAWSVVALGYMALWQGDIGVATYTLEEGIALMQQPDCAHPFGVALGQLCLGEVASIHSDYSTALVHYRDSYAGFEHIGNTWGMSESLVGIARHSLNVSLEQKRNLLERSLSMKRTIGDDRGAADVMSWLSLVTKQIGDLDTTHRLHQDSLAMQEAIGDKYGAARTLNRMAEMMRQLGEYDAALPYYQRSLKYYQELGIPHGIFLVQHNIGHVLLLRRDIQAALSNFKSSLLLSLSLGNKEGIALALAGLGGVAIATGRASEGVTYLAAAQTLLHHIQYDFESTDRLDYERHLAVAREQLHEAEFEAAWEQGCASIGDYTEMTEKALRLS